MLKEFITTFIKKTKMEYIYIFLVIIDLVLLLKDYVVFLIIRIDNFLYILYAIVTSAILLISLILTLIENFHILNKLEDWIND